jgi:hypothetical protein
MRYNSDLHLTQINELKKIVRRRPSEILSDAGSAAREAITPMKDFLSSVKLAESRKKEFTKN